MAEQVFIVLFRGINVGGRVAKMETLRTALDDAGFGNVKTYIQSGNVVLTSDKSEKAVTELIDKTFSDAFGYSSRPTVRSMKQWQAMAATIGFVVIAVKFRMGYFDLFSSGGVGGRLLAIAVALGAIASGASYYVTSTS